ncbi:MAG TPA: energy-coupling factor transporter ATPase [Ktedonobacteraceae bacterium]|nr:energy-coupling factor transporter ATPase [Ktedonobacteraceae bacterium]
MIEIQHVAFHYSAQGEQDVPPALHDVSLQIHEGETIAIIGHNGSGKSTLAKLLAAILFPQNGSIVVDGLPTDTARGDIWTIRQRVGMIFQNPDDQLIASTVIDDVAFGPENLGLPRAEIAQRVQEALELLDLTELAQLPISELSVSLKQRVAIAGVLAMRPRYLLLDEPTTMISGHTARQLLETIQRLAHERNMAVIHITHFMHEIVDFDRVIVMDGGRVLMDGTPETVFARADELQAIGLDVPLVTRLGRHLAKRGWPLPEVVLHPHQLLSWPDSPYTDRAASLVENGTQNNEPLAISDVSPSNDPPLAETESKHDLFDVQNIFYTYQRNTPFARPALQGLTLRIQAGRTTALVGPSGAGKSTLIDLLAGLIKPHAGVFLFEGANTAGASFKLTRIRSRVGIVFQSPESQIFEETVGKDVSFGPRQQGVPLAESRRRVQESLQTMGLPYEDFRSRYTYALSGGQKRRVAIAGVLAQQPEVIIFDEPMAGLDPRGRNELFQLIASLKRRPHLTIIYASSSLKDVVEIADVIHVLDAGRVALSGTPREILAQAETLHALDIALPEATRLSLAFREDLPGLPSAILNLAELETALEKELPSLFARQTKE